MYRCTTRDVTKNALEDANAASLVLHAENFASATEKDVPKFTHRLCWAQHNLCRYKGFQWTKFSRIWIESKDLRENTFKENPYIRLFYPVCHISLIISETYILLNKNNRYYTKNN